jgi:exodeoxyribonuclease VII large subunit
MIPMSPSLARPGGNLPEFTVAELSVALKRTVEGAFGRVRVRGEVSGLRRPGSGHLYFNLKDKLADDVLAAVCFRAVAGGLRVRPEDGLEVVATGRITTYPGQSRYQIVVESLEVAGVGAWLALLEERRRRLAAEGLFAAERKRKPPFLPEVIGVVTSPTGAVIRDILHRLADRFPRRVLIPGGTVPRPDVIIVARGGGSIEDLWPFNEEVVVRAAAASAVALISAIGHETDVTLLDLVADLRAPTPTAAAEMAVPVRSELIGRVLDLGGRLIGALGRELEARRSVVAGLARGLPDPRRSLERKAQDLDGAAESLRRMVALALERRASRLAELGARLRHPREVIAAMHARLARAAAGLRPQDFLGLLARQLRELAREERRLAEGARRAIAEATSRLAAQARLLDSVGYQQVLARGFVLARDAAGRPVTSARAAVPGRTLTLTFHDGERRATVAPEGAKPKPAEERAQGKLL